VCFRHQLQERNTLLTKLKYIGLDVHQASISVAVLEESGKLVMQSVIATQAAAILEFLAGLRGTLYLTFEEGTYSAWLYDLLVGRVGKLVVCNPRKNALLKSGNKSDRIHALKTHTFIRVTDFLQHQRVGTVQRSQRDHRFTYSVLS